MFIMGEVLDDPFVVILGMEGITQFDWNLLVGHLLGNLEDEIGFDWRVVFSFLRLGLLVR